MLSDAHVHLDFFEPSDREKLLQSARQAGVGIIITAGMSPESSLEAIRIAGAEDIVYAAVGVHPWNVTAILDDETYGTLRDLALENEKVIAVSELGLDFARAPGTKDAQLAVFRQQIRLGREVNKPLIFHSRDAHEDTVRILREEKAAEVGGAIHGFTGTPAMAQDYLDMDFYISFGRAIIRPENEALRQTAKDIPLKWLLIETDTAPGYANAAGTLPPGPAGVSEVAETLAQVKGLNLSDIEQTTTENIKRLARIRP